MLIIENTEETTVKFVKLYYKEVLALKFNVSVGLPI